MRHMLLCMVWMLLLIPVVVAASEEGELFRAIKHDDHATMERLLEGKDINTVVADGYPLLPTAAMLGSEQTVAWLLDRGADPNKAIKGLTALHLALQSKLSHKTLMKLVASGADIHARTDKGQTLLYMALHKDVSAFLQILLKQGVDVNAQDTKSQTVLHHGTSWPTLNAERGKLLKGVMRLLEAGADPNIADKKGRHALHLAVKKGKEGYAALLIQFGADVQAVDAKGNTVLHYAAQAQRNPNIFMQMMQHPLDIEAQNVDGYTPLAMAAASRGKASEAVVAALLAASASLDTVNRWGRTPLIDAVAMQKRAVVEHLLKAGADPNHIPTNQEGGVYRAGSAGWSALHYAADAGNAALVKLLLAYGGNPLRPEVASGEPSHAIDMARGKGHQEVVRLLEEAVR